MLTFFNLEGQGSHELKSRHIRVNVWSKSGKNECVINNALVIRVRSINDNEYDFIGGGCELKPQVES